MAAIELEDEFGDIIGKARLGLRRSLEETAKDAGLPTDLLRDFENYERSPNRDETGKVASALQLDGERLWAIASGKWAPAEEPEDADPDARVIRLMNYVGGWPVFSFLLVCKKTNACAIVDTAAHPEQIIETAEREELNPSLILLTHGHADHVEGVDALQKRFKVPVVMGEDMKPPRHLGETAHLAEGETVHVGELTVKMMKTPGHSEGCVTFLCGSLAIIGDVIFSGSIGKPNRSYEQSRASAAKLLALPDNTRLYPGHGPSTTVGEEKAHNPFFA